MHTQHPSNVVAFQQRPSKADRAFVPIVGQEVIDHQELRKRLSALWWFVGIGLSALALACFIVGHLLVGWLFLGGYAVAKCVELSYARNT